MIYRDRLLDKAERKLGRYAIPNLMTWLVLGMAAVYLLDLSPLPILPFISKDLSPLLAFDRGAILRGQVWRLATFVLVPPARGLFNLLSVLLHLYFYWFIGTQLEAYWGKFRFNAYYLVGMGCAIIAGAVTGVSTNIYLNLSLFLALAILNPDREMLLFFALPITMKWLALIDAGWMLLTAIQAGPAYWVALLMSLVPLALFFWRDVVDLIQSANRRRKWKKNWK